MRDKQDEGSWMLEPSGSCATQCVSSRSRRARMTFSVRPKRYEWREDFRDLDFPGNCFYSFKFFSPLRRYFRTASPCSTRHDANTVTGITG